MKTIYLSRLLKRDFPATTDNLEQLFKSEGISFEYLDDTKDYWARDYMPIQLPSKEFVQYKYNPDYLNNDKNRKFITDVDKVTPDKIKNNLIYTDIVMDGGNFVRLNNKAIMTDKIYEENPSYSKSELDEELKKVFKLDELIIVPRPDDEYGHTDGMVRWIDDENVVINDFTLESKESKKFNSNLIKSLEEHGLKISKLKYFDEFFTESRDWGAYLNFIEINNLLIVPTHGIEEDEKNVNQLKNLYPNCSIKTINFADIIKKEGALHCVTWETNF